VRTSAVHTCIRTPASERLHFNIGVSAIMRTLSVIHQHAVVDATDRSNGPNIVSR